MTWAIKQGWRYEPVEVVKETAKMVFYIDRSWSKGREIRQAKESFLPWRGTEDDARSIAAKMTSAKAEFERRRGAAADWFKRREVEILAAQRIEAGTDETPQEVRPEGREPGPEGMRHE